jgi:regulator of protease activity HflC (stomatin/prohibitin superfamily)
MLAYSKNSPTTYVLHYRNGRVRREGPGLAFWYFQPASTIVAVPLASRDVPFAFSEVTADFQPVTLQGQLTYRIADPKRLAGLLDFSVRASGRYLSDDPDKVPDRLVQTAQILARAVVQRLTLREVLVSSDTIVAEVVSALREAEPVRMLGVDILAPEHSCHEAHARDGESARSGGARSAATSRRRGDLRAPQRLG